MIAENGKRERERAAGYCTAAFAGYESGSSCFLYLSEKSWMRIIVEKEELAFEIDEEWDWWKGCSLVHSQLGEYKTTTTFCRLLYYIYRQLSLFTFAFHPGSVTV